MVRLWDESQGVRHYGDNEHDHRRKDPPAWMLMQCSEDAYRLMTCIKYGFTNGARYYAARIIAGEY